MDDFGIQLSGTAKHWYDNIACDTCRSRFDREIQSAVTIALNCFHRATHFPHGFLRDVLRTGLISRQRGLTLPIGNFQMGQTNDSNTILSLVALDVLPDCQCATMH